MSHPNLELIDRFFAAYSQRDHAGLREVLADGATWVFPGQHPLSGTHAGADAIVSFFDAMGRSMGSAGASVERLVQGVGERYLAECQHIRTSQPGGPNLDQPLCVLWQFENGKIVSGQHLAADQAQLDAFFSALTQ
jgi:ketosteroid isomerase-like protein